MDWQMTVAVVLVAGAALYLAGGMIRSWWTSKTACGGGCSCKQTQAPQTEVLIPSKDVVLRKRDPEPERQAKG
jgi:hypothetical protein